MAQYKNHGMGACVCLLVVFMLAQCTWAITYEYDDLNRLVQVNYDNGAVITYTYDAAGNITSVSQTPSEKEEPAQGGGTSFPGGGGGGSAPQPVLSLPSPGFIDLGTGLTKASFPVSNKYGQGTLVWKIGDIQYSSAAQWITSIEPLSGSTTSESMVVITASRSQLSAGVYNATLPMISNGGNGNITIRMEVSQAPPVSEDECSADGDCDDGLYCNGPERCLSGVCTAGSKPCGDAQICNEATDTCWTIKTIAAVGIRNQFLRPALKDVQRVWLVMRCLESNHFNKDSSAISLSGINAAPQGISVDKSRPAAQFWQFIFVPLLINKNATAGSWTVSIKSEIEGNIEETITCGFDVL